MKELFEKPEPAAPLADALRPQSLDEVVGQRHLRIGYNRAARLIEDMERAGMVSAMQSNGNREVLVPAKAE